MPAPRHRRAARFFRACLFVLALLGFSGPGSLAAGSAGQNLEAKLKGVFLLNFAKLVEWPGTAFPDAAAPIRVGILGDDPFGEVIDELFRGETARNRPLQVRRAKAADDLADCHIVFVASESESRVATALTRFSAKPILTVGDADEFVSAGGMIQFVREGKNLKFLINADLAASAGLKVSSRILALGKVSSPAHPAPAK